MYEKYFALKDADALESAARASQAAQSHTPVEDDAGTNFTVLAPLETPVETQSDGGASAASLAGQPLPPELQ